MFRLRGIFPVFLGADDFERFYMLARYTLVWKQLHGMVWVRWIIPSWHVVQLGI